MWITSVAKLTQLMMAKPWTLYNEHGRVAFVVTGTRPNPLVNFLKTQVPIFVVIRE